MQNVQVPGKISRTTLDHNIFQHERQLRGGEPEEPDDIQ